MKVFYTFGTDEHFLFNGGWVEVEAPSMKEAHAAFRRKFPDREPGILNCADYYTEEEFLESGMMGGNCGACCHKEIVAAGMDKGISLAGTDGLEGIG